MVESKFGEFARTIECNKQLLDSSCHSRLQLNEAQSVPVGSRIG